VTASVFSPCWEHCSILLSIFFFFKKMVISFHVDRQSSFLCPVGSPSRAVSATFLPVMPSVETPDQRPTAIWHRSDGPLWGSLLVIIVLHSPTRETTWWASCCVPEFAFELAYLLAWLHKSAMPHVDSIAIADGWQSIVSRLKKTHPSRASWISLRSLIHAARLLLPGDDPRAVNGWGASLPDLNKLLRWGRPPSGMKRSI
jgi:hypothetical protein